MKTLSILLHTKYRTTHNTDPNLVACRLAINFISWLVLRSPLFCWKSWWGLDDWNPFSMEEFCWSFVMLCSWHNGLITWVKSRLSVKIINSHSPNAEVNNVWRLHSASISAFIVWGLRAGKAVLYYVEADIARFSPGRLGFKARTLHAGFVVEEVAHLRTLCFCHDN